MVICSEDFVAEPGPDGLGDVVRPAPRGSSRSIGARPRSSSRRTLSRWLAPTRFCGNFGTAGPDPGRRPRSRRSRRASNKSRFELAPRKYSPPCSRSRSGVFRPSSSTQPADQIKDCRCVPVSFSSMPGVQSGAAGGVSAGQVLVAFDGLDRAHVASRVEAASIRTCAPDGRRPILDASMNLPLAISPRGPTPTWPPHFDPGGCAPWASSAASAVESSFFPSPADA